MVGFLQSVNGRKDENHFPRFLRISKGRLNTSLCLNWLVTCFRFQNMFWKNINCFRFWWKTYTKRCTSNYVISRVKRPFPLHFAVSQVLSILGYDLENGRMPCKQKYCIKNMAVKIPILILFRFCLLCWRKNHLFGVLSSVVAASCFNFIGPCRWF